MKLIKSNFWPVVFVLCWVDYLQAVYRGVSFCLISVSQSEKSHSTSPHLIINVYLQVTALHVSWALPAVMTEFTSCTRGFWLFKKGDWQSAAFFFIIMEAKGTARIADAEDSPLPAWLYDDRENKYMKPVPVGKRKIKTDLNGSFKVWMWGSVEGAGSHDLLNGTTKPSSPEDGLICGTTSAAFMKSCFGSYYIQDIIPKT